MRHIPVLLHESVSALNLTPESVVIDCTLGAGGHAREILQQLGPRGNYIGIDADPIAIEVGEELIKNSAAVHLINQNFRHIKEVSRSLSLAPDAILADLGWRTEQFEAGGKGFSFRTDEPLLMTFGAAERHLFTAYDVVNDWEESSLLDIIRGYGEERFAGRISKAIVTARLEREIQTSGQLAEIITGAVPGHARFGRIHPATRTFQAIRMAVNDELGALHDLLEDGFSVLKGGGRIAIISFHSLEDRIVKQFFKEKIAAQEARRLFKKPITASQAEIEQNPRARSAKLRVIEKIQLAT